MGDRVVFHFQFAEPPHAPMIELSAAEVEQWLLQKLAEARSDPTEALRQLAHFHKRPRSPQQ
jgi:hypothetical protein